MNVCPFSVKVLSAFVFHRNLSHRDGLDNNSKLRGYSYAGLFVFTLLPRI